MGMLSLLVGLLKGFSAISKKTPVLVSVTQYEKKKKRRRREGGRRERGREGGREERKAFEARIVPSGVSGTKFTEKGCVPYLL